MQVCGVRCVVCKCEVCGVQMCEVRCVECCSEGCEGFCMCGMCEVQALPPRVQMVPMCAWSPPALW